MRSLFILFMAMLCVALSYRGSAQVPATTAPPKCECKHIQVLEIELRNAQTLRDNFMRKIPDLKKLGVLSSLGELHRFAKSEARTGVVNVPGYKGPLEVDYDPHGNHVGESGLKTLKSEELCRMQKSAVDNLDAAVNASACSGIGEALRIHEDVHKSYCLSKGFTAYLDMSGADRAQEEVAAYSEQISKLKQILDEATKTCRFSLKFDSEIERTQGATREFGRVRASVDLQAASLKDNLLELAPAETMLEHLEYSWTDKAVRSCTSTGSGNGGRFRMISGQLTLKPPDSPPKLDLAAVTLAIDPGQTTEVHTITCSGRTMSFPGTYWSAAFGMLHGGTTFTASDWTVEPGQQAQARKVFETTRVCNNATCKERTAISLQQHSEGPAIALRY
jgi:hypothetical protein